jgi:CxxC motif-containing protein (DUF1111 family)
LNARKWWCVSRASVAWVVVMSALFGGCGGPSPAPMTDTPGEAVAGLTDAERGRFLLGRALFERLATPHEGLGPLFNGERCSTCHDQPTTGGAGTAVRVLKATGMANGRCTLLEAKGGDNIQLRATPMLIAEGLGPEEVPAEATATALVTSPPLYGLGLLEAVPSTELERHSDPEDADGDGISGRLARFADGRAAPFGRKGDAATVGDFVESALRFELGFTTEDHPLEELRNGVAVPQAADPAADPEMDAETMGILTDYIRLLAPPAPEAPASAEAADSIHRGEDLFQEVGCARCHVPSLITGSAPESALTAKRIQAYSDLLVHDIGGATGDVCTPQAGPGEYRTTPLWGLRYRSIFLHDGSAYTLQAAIEAHLGEAEAVTRAFHDLEPDDRALLLRFLSHL